MKVVTWNLGYWQHKKNHTEGWKYLREEIKPDVALLQEISPPALPKGEYLLFKKTPENWGTALYTRNMPFEEIPVKKYSERVAAAKLECSGGQVIVAVSIHAPIVNGRVFPYLDEIFDEWKDTVFDFSSAIGNISIKLFSFEIKRELNFSNLRESFSKLFQTHHGQMKAIW